MIKKSVFLLVPLLLTALVSALDINLNDNTFGNGDNLIMKIDSRNGIAKYVYFYEYDNNEPIGIKSLNCENICYGEVNLEYKIPESFDGRYYIAVYDYETKDYVKKEFSVSKDKYKIYLKSREFVPDKGVDKNLVGSIIKGHFLLQFRNILDDEEKNLIQSKGVKLLSYIPNRAWLIYFEGNVNEITDLENFRYVGKVELKDKMDIKLYNLEIDDWAKTSDKVKIRLVFYSDINEDEINNLLSKYNYKFLEKGLLNDYNLEVKMEDIKIIANKDIVKWVEEGIPEDIENNDGIRMDVDVDVLYLNPYSLSGENIKIGMWDKGEADTEHSDLKGRVFNIDTSNISDHSTHVAGTLIGDGSLSNGVYKGLAYKATIYTYSFLLADNEAEEHEKAIEDYGIDLSQNSWGNPYQNGEYTLRSVKFDSIVRGIYGKKIPIIFSSGNNGPIYGSVNMPGATAKNTISVGAVDSNDDSSKSWSSRGPTSDGRLKPEVVAPGCENYNIRDDSDPNKTIWSTFPGNKYYGMCGTSRAAPVVSGGVALIIEEGRRLYNKDLLPSSIKALIVSGCKDLMSLGPDFVTGYGRVDFKASIDLLRTGKVLEDEIKDTTEKEYFVYVDKNQDLKITLAWDDHEADLLSNLSLVNDLDLVVTSPDNIRYYPWTLDPKNPSLQAVRSKEDHLNNLEQVYVNNAMPGLWSIKVRANNLIYSQSFSLVSNIKIGEEVEHSEKPANSKNYSVLILLLTVGVLVLLWFWKNRRGSK